MLVVVVEPTKSAIAAYPHLFGPAAPIEQRQLSVAPSSSGGRASSRSGGRAGGRSQSRFTSVAAVERSSRDARGGTPLFRGMTPASEYGDEFDPTPMFMPSPSPTPGSGPGPGPGQSSRAPSVAPTANEPDAPNLYASIGDEEEALDGFALATQMLERDEEGGGNDLDEGD